MATDDALVFPIGQCLGTFWEPGAIASRVSEVRVGPDAVRLTDAQFAVWGLAHGTLDRDLTQPWTRSRLLEACTGAGVSDAGTLLTGLLDDGLAVALEPGTDAAIAFARGHRMVPSMLGLGNSPEEPRLYSVGLPGMPLVQMTSMVYDLYAWAHLDPDLWSACEGAAETARNVDVVDRTATDPARLLDALLEALHTLLGPNAVHLDTRTTA